MKETTQLKNLMESVGKIQEGRYWDRQGEHEKQAAELAKLVPLSGPSKTLRGEIFRAAMKIYYDYYNNGFGNVWPQTAQFLMSHVDLSVSVTQMLVDHAMGNIGTGVSAAVEEMMNSTIEQIYEMPDSKNTVDMWDTEYDESMFEPEHDDYDDEWDDEDEEDQM